MWRPSGAKKFTGWQYFLGVAGSHQGVSYSPNASCRLAKSCSTNGHASESSILGKPGCLWPRHISPEGGPNDRLDPETAENPVCIYSSSKRVAATAAHDTDKPNMFTILSLMKSKGMLDAGLQGSPRECLMQACRAVEGNA